MSVSGRFRTTNKTLFNRTMSKTACLRFVALKIQLRKPHQESRHAPADQECHFTKNGTMDCWKGGRNKAPKRLQNLGFCESEERSRIYSRLCDRRTSYCRYRWVCHGVTWLSKSKVHKTNTIFIDTISHYYSSEVEIVKLVF